MKQTERIKQMEQCLEKASVAVMQLSEALDKYIESQDAIATLDKYYGSEEWKTDFAADEAGQLPKDLKRGVLSEDGIWNLLSDSRDLNNRLRAFIDQQ